MPEATKRPWYASHDGNGYDHIQSAEVNEDNYVARVDSTDAQGNANADLIVKAVNSHDALVAACEAMRDSGMFDWEGAVAYKEEAALVMAALEQVK
tara:strand:- start:209 stop:496 length:288 start_codon:yes stop_codon:yes gene_type:complete